MRSRLRCRAGQRVELDAAGVLEGVHRQEGVCNRAADRQQAVVAQHQIFSVAQVGLRARLLVLPQGHIFAAMIDERRTNERTWTAG